MGKCSRCKKKKWPTHKRKGAEYCDACLKITGNDVQTVKPKSNMFMGIDLNYVPSRISQPWKGTRGIKRIKKIN